MMEEIGLSRFGYDENLVREEKTFKEELTLVVFSLFLSMYQHHPAVTLAVQHRRPVFLIRGALRYHTYC